MTGRRKSKPSPTDLVVGIRERRLRFVGAGEEEGRDGSEFEGEAVETRL